MDHRQFHVENWRREALAAFVLAGLVLLFGTLAQILPLS